MTEPGYVRTSREVWTGFAPAYAEGARQAWARSGPDWGVWSVPEQEVGLLGDVSGLDVLEIGCGTAYFSAWLQRRGARPVGLDLTRAQLSTAQHMQAAYGVRFPLVEADGQVLPLRDGCMDLVISEYGASIWCDPHRWVPEAARVLRPGGRLVFLVNAWLAVLCSGELGQVGPRLQRGWFDTGRIEWPDDHSVEFHLSYGDWVRVLRSQGLNVEGLVHLPGPKHVRDERNPHVPADWARRWPAEDVWAATKRVGPVPL